MLMGVQENLLRTFHGGDPPQSGDALVLTVETEGPPAVEGD